MIGIVAEYNPFHNGHAHQLSLIRSQYGSPVAVVLSSSFTQRGEAALADKWARTEMALQNGVDLVFELPFPYACNAGPEFAHGAIDTLAATGFVTHLSFGMENPSYPLETILSILNEEPPSFKDCLRKKLAEGQSYSKAVAESLETVVPGSGLFLSAPNNALAVSYLLRIRQKNYPLTPLPLQRAGKGYHDHSQDSLASATAIRKEILSSPELSTHSWVKEAMPCCSFKILRREQNIGRLYADSSKLWTLLCGLFLRTSPQELSRFAGMDEGIENLFIKNFPRSSSYEDFIGRCVCARYTRSRLQRQTIRLLAGLNRWTAQGLTRCRPPYIRLLGANTTGRQLLRENTSSMQAPLITRLPSASGTLARSVAQLEFNAAKLRELLLPYPNLCREERQKPILMD